MDEKKLKALVEQKSTLKKIADVMSCSQSNVRYWIKKFKLDKKKNTICEGCGKALVGRQRRVCSVQCKIKIRPPRTYEQILNNANISPNWKEIQKYYDAGKTTIDVKLEFGVHTALLIAATQAGLFTTRTASETMKLRGTGAGRHHTEETKKKMSDAKKKLYREHPEKHNWKSSTKLISPPCEKLKTHFRSLNIQFEPEFTPLKDRFYSIDIAFPKKLIAVEVNGNQHYNSDGTLKPYYKEKHDLIAAAGWEIVEMHFSLCYNDEYIKSLVKKIENSPTISENGPVIQPHSISLS